MMCLTDREVVLSQGGSRVIKCVLTVATFPQTFIIEAVFGLIGMYGVLLKSPAIIVLSQNVIKIFMLNDAVDFILLPSKIGGIFSKVS